MKTSKILFAPILALAVLGGLIWALAWRQPTAVRAEASAKLEDGAGSLLSPKTLPPPYLGHPKVVDAPFGRTPTVDGLIIPGEYAGADKVTFPGYGGYYHEIEAFVVQDAISLYIAFDSRDTTPYPFVSGGGTGPALQVFLDSNNSKDPTPQPGDYMLTVRKGGGLQETQGTGTGWGGLATGNWTAAVYTATWGWQAEFEIALSKLNITTGTFSAVGLALAEVWTPSWPKDWYWPAGGDWDEPDTWGDLVSSSNWGTFYWKPGPWEDYAPSGMPDFDQRQDAWSVQGPTAAISTHCGPVAMANSLWWFDSKFETLTGTTPPVVSDTYRLVTAYGPHDDHDDQNVIPFVDDLANNYFNTNDVQGTGAWTGTYVTDMHSGTIKYLRDHGLWDDYLVTLVISPTFDWVADEVMRSEDVILLLGFYQDIEPDPSVEVWVRVGGHYVTVAGVDPANRLIAFSDPFLDNAEAGSPGRILSGTLVTHYPPHPGTDPTIHNDAGNVSHDIYTATASSSPGGVWGPGKYPWESFILLLVGPLNPHPEPGAPVGPWNPNPMMPVQVEVEFALTVSPYTWKSSGYWEADEADPVRGTWQPWVDYAPNGVPDFDQKQDGWTNPPAKPVPPAKWTFCGPVAAANSLWWFDSKFEPSPVGPQLPPYQPPITYNDNYPMVWSYDGRGIIPPWDDHDPLNVDDPGTPWPPLGWPFSPPMPLGQGEFVEDLALYFLTDQPPGIGRGTVITNLYLGIDQYLIDHNLREGYVITQVKSPDFWWVAEEVEHSEDVILLLGFWERTGGPGEWQRLGGHYVTVPGVDKQGGLIAFSDPYYDGAGFAWPYAYPAGWPTVMGRVGNGWLMPHNPWGHPSIEHNDAGNVSHDIYYVMPTDSPGGSWGPGGYVEGGRQGVEPFWGQNGTEEVPPSSTGFVQAEVDWAVAVSPVADVWVTKRFDPTTTTPGTTITFSIVFTNVGSLPAEDVALTDNLPAEMINPTFVGYWTSNGLTVTRRTGTTFTWDLPDLAWMEWGTITVTAQVDPALAWPSKRTITNVVQISTSSLEQYQVPEKANVFTETLTVQTADVVITKTVQPANVVPGDRVTYTLAYANHGSATAASTSITDSLPSQLTGAAYTYANNYGAIVTHPSQYVWNVGDVPAGGSGVVTITAQVQSGLTSGGSIVNQATIGTPTPESDDTNNSSSDSQTLCIPPAGAAFGYTPSQPKTNQAVTFTGSVTQGDPTPTHTWDFDDGTGSGNPVNHTYTTAGDYTVWMTATNTCGYDVYSETLSVCALPANLTIQHAPLNPLVNQTVFFTATATGGSITYAWAADDGWSATGATATPNHAFISRGNHTVWLTATNGCGPSYTSTVVFVREFSADLQPASAVQVGALGQTVTYTLMLYNTGNVADTYTVAGAISGQPWTTNWPGSAGPVAAGGYAQFDVTVHISSTASSDDTSRATITATSQGDGSKSDTSVLTTTAHVGAITRGVAVAPPKTTGNGDPGDTVTYTLRVTNTGNVADVVGLSHTGPATWTVSYSLNPLSLAAGEGQDTQVYVGIPASVPGGSTGVITVTAASQGDPAYKGDSALTTTVSWRFIYLPLVLRNY